MTYTFCIPTMFGLEGIVRDECRHLHFENVQGETGRVYFTGDEHTLATANLAIRCGERVLILLARFHAESFEDLFQGVHKIPWESVINKNSAFPVKGFSLDSQLHSVPDCQKIVKKAVVERLKEKYHISWFPETGEKVQIQFAIRKNECEVYLDTTGVGLHKRGYRPDSNSAPLRETLAAGMILLSQYRGRETFIDPMCGSGTILIEAALIAKNRAPGMKRGFDAMRWPFLPEHVFEEERNRLKSLEYHGNYQIHGSDIDPECVQLTRRNAERAGLSGLISVEKRALKDLTCSDENVLLITNPPYGKRMGEQAEADEVLRTLGKIHHDNPKWTMGIISPHTRFELLFAKGPTKKRRLYNGMILCDYYIYRK